MATIAGFAFSPLPVADIATAIARLRDVLSDQIYESLTRKDRTMTTAATTTTHTANSTGRAELNAVSE